MFSRIMAPLTQSEKFGRGALYPHLCAQPGEAGRNPTFTIPTEFGRRVLLRAIPRKIVPHKAARSGRLAALKGDEGRMKALAPCVAAAPMHAG